MTACTKRNLNKGRLLTIISLCEKLHVEKLSYTVKFQEDVQSSNAVSSSCLFPKVSSSCVKNEVKQRGGWIMYNVNFKF